MNTNQQSWAVVTKGIFTAVLIFSFGSILAGIVSAIGGVADTVSDAMDFVSSGTISAGPSFFEILSWLLTAAVVVGYVLYILGLGKLGAILKDGDSKAIGYVRIGALILIVGSICNFFLPAFVVYIANIIAYVLMFMGFSTLKKSTAIDAVAAKGFGRLYMAMLLTLLGAAISLLFTWIPFLGSFFAFVVLVLNVIAFILIILGWKAVKDAPEK